MVKPRPFTRPSVSIGEDAPKKEWRLSHAGTLREGDVVKDFGLIEKLEVLGGAFQFTNPAGASTMFGWATEVRAFTAHGDDATLPASPAPEPFGA